MRILRLAGRLPHQIVLYIGEERLRMDTELRGADVWFRCHAVDIRTLDGDRLLESPDVGDNVIAILARLRDQRQAVRKIVERTADPPPAGREVALSQLLILAGLRRLAGMVVCHLRHKVAAGESITWPTLRQSPFNLNIAVPPRGSVLKHKVATRTEWKHKVAASVPSTIIVSQVGPTGCLD